MRDARDVMAELAASGLSADQHALVMELCASLGRPVRTARQERNAKHYQVRKERLKASETPELRPIKTDGASELRPIKTIKTVSDGDPPAPTEPNSLGSSKDPPSPLSGAQTPTTKPSRGSSIPPDWQPNERHFELAADKGQGREFVEQAAEGMRDWAVANSNRQVARKADWDRTFTAWLKRELQKVRSPPNGASGQQSFRVVNGNSGANYVNGKRVSPYRGSLAEAARDSLNEALVRSNEGEGIHPDISRRLSFIGRG